ncbi:MAG: cache domain-containing protein [Desulfosarcinaceae bacterium]|nr:cache domain-containing protein [Desulfosarcinaceae bacterium]
MPQVGRVPAFGSGTGWFAMVAVTGGVPVQRLLTFTNLGIRSKLLISYSLVFMIVITLGGLVNYAILRQTVEANIESELKNATAGLLNMVKTAVSVSIKNHLRAVAERNLEMVRYLYGQYEAGQLSEAEAKRRAEGLLLSQTIGTTGYIACVNSKGTMVLHPKAAWLGQDISHFDFVKEMMARKRGYIDAYEWRNPGEQQARPKALYMVYFAPWDWIINVSSYRREFQRLVNVDDFRESVLDLQFGQTGYAFVVNGSGEVIIHPSLRGVNVFESQDNPTQPIAQMLAQKDGKIVYSWKNPGEARPRKKLVIFNYIPEIDWIVASSSYLNEFYAPLRTLSNVIIFTVLASFLLVLPLSSLIGRSITTPLQDLIHQLATATKGDFSARAQSTAGGEVGQLAQYYNNFMDRLEIYSRDLNAEVAERRQAEEALRESEEKYRSVMEAAPDPIIVYDMDGRVTYLNPAFTKVFGWQAAEILGNKLDHFVPPETWEETRRGLALITAGQSLSSVETRRYVKSGDTIDVSIRGAVYTDRAGEPMGSVIIHRDVTDLKKLEKRLLDVGDKERQKIGQDLHDDLCPHLIGIEGFTRVLASKAAAAAPEIKALADRIAGLIKDAIGKSRSLARGLCPVYLVDHGLEFSLQELTANTKSVFNQKCRFTCTQPITLRNNTISTHIFRIAQEAVHNAARHAEAEQIEIHLSVTENVLQLTVSDDGKGDFEVVGAAGMGLRIMAYRAKMIGAALDLFPTPGEGTQVQLSLPLPSDGDAVEA